MGSRVLSAIAALAFATTATAATPSPALWASIERASIDADLDPSLVRALISVESNFDPALIGTRGEFGLLQLRPTFFGTSTGDVVRDLERGLRHLSKIRTSCPHRAGITWVICHNLGATGAARIKNPKAQTYFRKVVEAYGQEKRIQAAIAAQ